MQNKDPMTKWSEDWLWSVEGKRMEKTERME
jgi:hypothetical protein